MMTVDGGTVARRTANATGTPVVRRTGAAAQTRATTTVAKARATTTVAKASHDGGESGDEGEGESHGVAGDVSLPVQTATAPDA